MTEQWNGSSCGDVKDSFWQFPGDSITYANAADIASQFSSDRTVLYAWLTDAGFDVNWDDWVSSYAEDSMLYTVTHNPCSPTLAVPSRMLSLNPDWSGCISGISGFYDPPSALTAGHGFRTPGPGDNTVTGAIPGATPYPATATLTEDPGEQSSAKLPIPNPPEPVASQSPSAVGNSPPSNQVPPNPNLNDPNDANNHNNPNDPNTSSDPNLHREITKYIIGSITLTAGELATISNKAISLQPDGSSVVISGKTLALSAFASGTSIITSFEPAASSGLKLGVIVGGKTMPLDAVVSGGAFVVAGGKTVAANDASIVMGGMTVPLSVLLTGSRGSGIGAESQTGLGGVIASIGGFDPASTVMLGSSTLVGGNDTQSNAVLVSGSQSTRIGSIHGWALGFSFWGSFIAFIYRSNI
jgi:hypothetical protein